MIDNTLMQWKISTPVGPLYLVASTTGLREISRKPCPAPMARSLSAPSAPAQLLAQASRELEEYFSRKRRRFEIPLEPQGTTFQQRVWRELQTIPYGRTCSYKDIAKGIGQAGATRAVGNANGKNPLCIVIPCHRVIAADGSIGGYSSGLDMKRKLLQLEQD